MLNFMKKLNFDKNSFSIQKKVNDKFSSKLFLNYGIQLGGHIQLLILTTTSVIYGIRTNNIIIDINKTLLELIKVLKILEGLGFCRSVLYFVNSIITIRSSLYHTYGYYNRHLFFPGKFKILNPLKKLRLLKVSKKKIKNLKKYIGLKNFFLWKSGKHLLRKFFISSKWPYGFVSNNKGFSKFVFNVFHEKVKIGKLLESFHEKVKTFIDYYPFLPHYGFIGDHRINYWVVNEFKSAGIPNCSIIDTCTTKAFFSMYGIPGNGCSMDTSLFYIILMVSYYLVGYNQMTLKFSVHKSTLEKVDLKKNLFFKHFRKLEVQFSNI